MEITRNIIIDCDPGTDDALALFLASRNMRHEILAVISSYGNAVLDHTHRNLLALSELLELDVEIFRGSTAPLGKDGFVPTDYHGTNGLLGMELPLSADQTRDGGVEGLYECIRRAGRVRYLIFGPLTNAAKLLLTHPDAADYIEEFVIMGGGLAIGNVPVPGDSVGAEYNFSLDPMAVALLFASSSAKVLVPLDLTHTLAFDAAEVRAIVGISEEEIDPDTNALRHVMGAVLYGNLASSLREGNAGAIIHDAAVVAYGIVPDVCSAEYRRLLITEEGVLREDPMGADVTVISAMKKETLAALLRQCFE